LATATQQNQLAIAEVLVIAVENQLASALQVSLVQSSEDFLEGSGLVAT
jgi:hypothetical protein